MSALSHLSSQVAQFLDKHQQILLPDPDEAMDIALSIYIVGDPDITETERRVAQAVVDRFQAHKTEPGTVANAYLNCLHGIIGAYARGLRSRRRNCLDEIARAGEEKRKQEKHVDEWRVWKVGLVVIWRQLSPIIMFFLFGYLLGEVISLVIPETLAKHTGTHLPAVLIGVACTCVWMLVMGWMSTQRQNQIDITYNERVREAMLFFSQGKLEDLRLYRTRLCEAWKHYTGEDHPERSSYATVMSSDIAKLQLQIRRAYRRNDSLLDVTVRILRLFRKATRVTVKTYRRIERPKVLQKS